MPANLYHGQDARDIAVYIAKCAGNPSCGVTATTEGGPPRGNDDDRTAGAVEAARRPDGKKVFETAGCSGCHTLKDAGASGNVGPNLDQLKPSESTVAHQVEVGGGAMPSFKGQLSAAEIKAVAKYVSSVAGK